MATVDPQTPFITLGNNVILARPHAPDTNTTSQRTPEWMVEISGNLSGSNVSGFETYCELFDFHYSYKSHTAGHTGKDLFNSSALDHSPVSLLIPINVYSSRLRDALNKAKKIDTIKIRHIGGRDITDNALQIITYESCRIIEVVQHGNQLGIAFLFVKVTEQNFDLSGNTGQNVASMDYGDGLRA